MVTVNLIQEHWTLPIPNEHIPEVNTADSSPGSWIYEENTYIVNRLMRLKSICRMLLRAEQNKLRMRFF